MRLTGRKLSRRTMLGLGGAGLLALGSRAVLSRPRGADAATAITIAGTPLGPLLPTQPERTRFGALDFRVGLALTSDSANFGGLSSLWRSPDGRDLVALSDNAMWLTARAVGGSYLSGLEDARMAPVLGAEGEPLWQTRAYDTEGLAIADGIAYVGIERVHEVRRFAWGRDGVGARGEQVPVPAEVKTLPNNGSLEAIAVAPPAHSLAGALIAIAEEAQAGETAPTRGWVLTGGQTGAFDVVRSDGFDITDLAFLGTGEALLLERRFTLRDGVACRIRRLAVDAIRPGALADGRVIFEADRAYAIDNMEGMALHRDPGTGEQIVTLISDDNFSPVQRTLLLEFRLYD